MQNPTKQKPKARADFEIGDHLVSAGTRRTIELPVSVMPDHTPATMSVHVTHGRKPGPVVFVSAAVHGDEVIGVEIVRRLLRTPSLDRLSGTILAVPIVNAFGFLSHSRYLPDRRDLNRSFPGSSGGSLASRLAHLFMTEIVRRSDCGIDLHSAAIHRTNLPQTRVSATATGALKMAEAFGAPVTLMSKIREGSMRGEAKESGVDILLYEAGEGLRFDENAVRIGHVGVLRVLHDLEMISARGIPKRKARSVLSDQSKWMRAPAGGLFRPFKAEGDMVAEGELLGVISDPFGEFDHEIHASIAGIIVGRSVMPIINEGDGVFHVAAIARGTSENAEVLSADLVDHPLFDEDEIV